MNAGDRIGRLVLCAVLAALSAGGAQEETDPDSVRVEVRVQARQPAVNHELSLREIQAKSGSKTPRGTTYLVGFTRMELEMGARLGTGARITAEGEKSVWAERLEVRAGYSAVDIFIPREYAKRSCPYEAVLDHEREHVARDFALLEEFAARLDAALKKAEWPTAAQPLHGLSEEEGRKRLEADLNAIVQPELEALKKKREQARAALDTRQNYAALRRRCDQPLRLRH